MEGCSGAVNSELCGAAAALPAALEIVVKWLCLLCWVEASWEEELDDVSPPMGRVTRMVDEGP